MTAARRIVVTGSECTGKSTTAAAVAAAGLAVSGSCSMPKLRAATLLVATGSTRMLSGVPSTVPLTFSPVVTQLDGKTVAGSGLPGVPALVVSWCS